MREISLEKHQKIKCAFSNNEPKKKILDNELKQRLTQINYNQRLEGFVSAEDLIAICELKNWDAHYIESWNYLYIVCDLAVSERQLSCKGELFISVNLYCRKTGELFEDAFDDSFHRVFWRQRVHNNRNNQRDQNKPSIKDTGEGVSQTSFEEVEDIYPELTLARVLYDEVDFILPTFPEIRESI